MFLRKEKLQDAKLSKYSNHSNSTLPQNYSTRHILIIDALNLLQRLRNLPFRKALPIF